MNDKRIVVGIASHKAYRMPEDPCYLPLYVGAALHPESDLGFQRDDEGDNISKKNPYYCELTGLYWLWKNAEADYKGLVHYRRLLGSLKCNGKDPYDRVVTGSELFPLLQEHGIVLAKKRKYFIETVYDHYAHTFDAFHFDACREVLSRRCSKYVPAWDCLMRSRAAHIYNMFVMRSDLFNAYCSWLFPVLDELVGLVGLEGMDAFQSRWPGRVSERLLDPWLETNGLDYIELPVVSPEPVDWIAKGKGFLAAKFLGKKYERSF